jgi:hypothetical protein
MNINQESFTTYKSLSLVLTTQTTSGLLFIFLHIEKNGPRCQII